MNYSDIIKNNNVNAKEILKADPLQMFSLPYSLVNDNLTPEEQVNIIENSDSQFVCYKLFDKLKKFDGTVHPDVFISFLKKFSSWSNETTEIIKMIDSHPERVKIICEILNFNSKYQNLVSNVVNNFITQYNLILKNFNEEIFETLASTHFSYLGDSEVEYLLEKSDNKEEHKKLFEQKSFEFIKKSASTAPQSKEYYSSMAYSIPDLLINSLTKEQCIELLDLYSDTADVSKEQLQKQYEYFELLMARISRENDKFDEESVMIYVKRWGWDVPSNLHKSKELIKLKTQALNLVPNYNNPFEHVKDGSIKDMHKTEHFEKLCESALKMENILKDETNLMVLESFKFDYSELPKEFIIELFEENYEYIEKAIQNSNNHYQFRIMKKLFTQWLKYTENKEHAFKKMVEYVADDLEIVSVVTNYEVMSPEYLDLLFNHKKEMGLIAVAKMIENDKDEFLDLIA